jgi:hypothetical protein
MSWVRGQFESHYEAARLDAPPRGKLEEYSRHVLAESARYQSDDDAEFLAAREAMATAAAVLLEFAGRGRPRKPRYASPAPRPSSTSVHNRTAEIRARYGRRA